jgi:hypothetical protein
MKTRALGEAKGKFANPQIGKYATRQIGTLPGLQLKLSVRHV